MLTVPTSIDVLFAVLVTFSGLTLYSETFPVSGTSICLKIIKKYTDYGVELVEFLRFHKDLHEILRDQYIESFSSP